MTPAVARGTRVAPAAALVALVGASAVLRTRAIDAGYWIDEGISVGIASHSLTDIPGLLEQDGSPPLYYLLLAVWTSLFGSGEATTHLLSLLAALAAIPAALWAGRATFGTRAGWAAAAVAATLPLLTIHAQETRMYALLALLSVLTTATFVLALVRGSRRAWFAFVALAVLLVYTHNWGLYLLLGLACALPLVRHRRAAAAAGLAVAAAYAPWVPSLLDQAARTGAPWSTTPDLGGLANPLTVPLGQGIAAILVTATAALGLRRAGREAAVIGIALAAAALAAWVGGQFEPNWADRYMTVFAGPVILLAGAGLAAAGRAGLAVLSAAVLVWALDGAPGEKSNAEAVARHLRPGDQVIVTHPEQTPVLRHYAGPGLRWESPLGPTPDPRVFDWRDASERLRAAEPYLVPRGRRIVLVEPARLRRGGPEWLDLVARRAADWHTLVERDPRLRRVAVIDPAGEHRNSTDLRALVYERAPKRP